MTASDGLVEAISAVFSRRQATSFRILAVTPHAYESTAPMRVVTSVVDGERIELLCKRSASVDNKSYGHRGGVGHEAQVYDRLLRHCGLPVATCYGAHRDEQTGDMWLVLEYLPDAVRLNHSVDPDVMPAAARWIGRLHRRATDAPVSGVRLNSYDADYYLGWFDRMRGRVSAAFGAVPWLNTLCNRVERDGLVLFDAARTVIHGEYYPKNILAVGGVVYPVDWESTARGVGEIDLASLVQSWSADVRAACARAYVGARWDGTPPAEHELLFEAASLYLLARWLGDPWEWTASDTGRELLGLVQATAERLGLKQ